MRKKFFQKNKTAYLCRMLDHTFSSIDWGIQDFLEEKGSKKEIAEEAKKELDRIKNACVYWKDIIDIWADDDIDIEEFKTKF